MPCQSRFHVSTSHQKNHFNSQELFIFRYLSCLAKQKNFFIYKNIRYCELPKISDVVWSLTSKSKISSQNWNKNSAIVLFIECWVDTKNEFEIMLHECLEDLCLLKWNVKAQKNFISSRALTAVVFRLLQGHATTRTFEKAQSTFITSLSLPFEPI